MIIQCILDTGICGWGSRHVPIHGVASMRSGRVLGYDRKEIEDPGEGSKYTVLTVTLDNVIADLMNERKGKLAGVMIQADGEDQEVLLGMKYALYRQEAGFIAVEVWFRRLGQNRRYFAGLRLLFERGYILFGNMGQRVDLEKLKPYIKKACDNAGESCLSNMLAVRPDLVEGLLENGLDSFFGSQAPKSKNATLGGVSGSETGLGPRLSNSSEGRR